MTADTKQMLRMELLARRRDLPDDQRAPLDSALTALLLAFVQGALAERAMSDAPPAPPYTVATYVPLGMEPGTTSLPQQLKDLGVRVLLPIVGAPGPLDWAEYQDASSLAPARMDLLEPTGPALGADAIAAADAIFVPGLAGDSFGMRMGRGGGFYDQSLPLASDSAPRLLCLYPWELREHIPTEPHDVPVTHIVTPTAIRSVNKH